MTSPNEAAQERLSNAVYNICQDDPDRVAYGIELLKDALAEKNISVNAPDEGGYTAISRVIDSGNVKAAQMLVQAGADPSIPDERGDSLLRNPLERLAMRGAAPEMISALGLAGADFPTPQENFAKVIHHICQDDPDRVRYGLDLLSRVLKQGNVDVNAHDDGGRTAISRIIDARNIEAAQMLTRAGADPSIPDERPSPFYKTPLEGLQRQNSHPAMLDVMLTALPEETKSGPPVAKPPKP
jgi:ankyrin repeat protein